MTVAWVPTGMKMGVGIVPWGVTREPVRAAEAPSRAVTLNWIADIGCYTAVVVSGRIRVRNLCPSGQRKSTYAQRKCFLFIGGDERI